MGWTHASSPGIVVAAITNWLLHAQGPPAYVVVGALVSSEAALFAGFFIPGETAVIVGGVLASVGSVNLWSIMAVVVFSAIAGDSIGYVVGRTWGSRLLARFSLQNNAAIARTTALLRKHGGPAVLIGRFVVLVRAVVPGLAGLSGLRYRTFLLFNALGGALWGVSFTLLGYFVGQPFSKALSRNTAVELLILGCAITGTLGYRLLRRRHHSHEDPSTLPDSHAQERQ
jgi:membrane-associated protein